MTTHEIFRVMIDSKFQEAKEVIYDLIDNLECSFLPKQVLDFLKMEIGGILDKTLVSIKEELSVFIDDLCGKED